MHQAIALSQKHIFTTNVCLTLTWDAPKESIFNILHDTQSQQVKIFSGTFFWQDQWILTSQNIGSRTDLFSSCQHPCSLQPSPSSCPSCHHQQSPKPPSALSVGACASSWSATSSHLVADLFLPQSKSCSNRTSGAPTKLVSLKQVPKQDALACDRCSLMMWQHQGSSDEPHHNHFHCQSTNVPQGSLLLLMMSLVRQCS